MWFSEAINLLEEIRFPEKSYWEVEIGHSMFNCVGTGEHKTNNNLRSLFATWSIFLVRYFHMTATYRELVEEQKTLKVLLHYKAGWYSLKWGFIGPNQDHSLPVPIRIVNFTLFSPSKAKHVAHHASFYRNSHRQISCPWGHLVNAACTHVTPTHRSRNFEIVKMCKTTAISKSFKSM